MAVKEILKIGNDTLRKTSHPVEKFNLRLWLLLRDMADTMYKAEGVGLAGPQIGILRRVVVIDVQDDHGLIELVNPEIIAAEGEQGGPEGCLSVPGRQGFVYRPQKVTVRAQDRHGKVFELTGEDLLARALCHEIDHLDGKMYVDIEDHEIVEEEDEEEQESWRFVLCLWARPITACHRWRRSSAPVTTWWACSASRTSPPGAARGLPSAPSSSARWRTASPWCSR